MALVNESSYYTDIYHLIAMLINRTSIPNEVANVIARPGPLFSTWLKVESGFWITRFP